MLHSRSGKREGKNKTKLKKTNQWIESVGESMQILMIASFNDLTSFLVYYPDPQ